MSNCDCPPANNNPSPYMVAAASIGVAKVIHDVSGHEFGPKTGYQYTKAGCERMDHTMTLLREKKEGTDKYVIQANERSPLIDRHAYLQPEMDRLQRATQTYYGSLRNWNSGRNFYHDSDDLYLKTKKSSSHELALHGQAQVEEELRRAEYDRASRSTHHSIPYNADNNQDEEHESGSGSGSGSEQPPWQDARSTWSSLSVRSRASGHSSSQHQVQYGPSQPQYNSSYPPQHYPSQGTQNSHYNAYGQPQASSSSRGHGYYPPGPARPY